MKPPSFSATSRWSRNWLAHCMIATLLLAVRLYGQTGDDSTGVSVTIKILNVAWNGSYPSPGLDASITDLGGTKTTPYITLGTTQTQQLVTRLAVGVTYTLNIGSSGVDSALALVVPPSGYVMEIG